MKKVGLIASFVGLIAVVTIAVLAIIYNGSDIAGLNYVRLSVNPKVEFVCHGETVQSINPINEEAKELCAQENFLNLNIEDACKKFVDLCARAGYIDVEKNDNAIKIDCITGLTQNLEVKVYSTISTYLKENQILGMVIENENDIKITRKAKEAGVDVDKYVLIESLTNLMPEKNFNDCKRLSKKTLIELINQEMKKLGNPAENYTQEQLNNKKILMDFNRVKFAKHVESITDESKSKFKEVFAKNQIELKKKVQGDFDKAYDTWRTNHINFVG